MADNKILESTEQLMLHLKYGERNAKTQDELAREMGVPPLSVRQMIHAARITDHIVICNYRDRFGYFLPETQDEVTRQYKQTVKRGKAVFAQLSSIIKALGAGDQMTLEDLIRETEAV